MDGLILYQKLSDLSQWLFPAVDNFPRREKFALCTQIKNSVYTLVRQTIRAQKSRDKLRHLFELDLELEMLRFLVRSAHHQRYLSTRRYEIVARMLSEIGKIVGGLFKTFGKGGRP